MTVDVEPSARTVIAVGTSVALVTGLGLVDAFTSTTLFGGLALGPLVAALAARRRWVFAVTGYALSWAVLLGAPERWTAAHALRIGLLLALSAVALVLVTARERYTEALRRSTHIAEVSQRALLGELPETPAAELAVRYLSATRDTMVGGDVYDVADTRWGLRLFVADLCGHGIEAVNGSAVLLGAFRRAAHHHPDLDAVADEIEQGFSVARSTHGLSFATGVLVQVNGGDVTVANCGHHDPLLISRSGHRWLSPMQRTTPFGLGPRPQPVRFAVIPGDRLLLYTDGLIEARHPEHGPFDLEANVDVLATAASARVAVDELVARLRRHTGGVNADDVVALMVQIRTSAEQPRLT
jgi:phosphoserine phosphatase RsbU/P